MSGSYNAGGTPGRVVLVDPTTLDDYNALGSATNPSVVVGNVASDGVDSGSPIKTGGRAVNTASARTAFGAVGDRVDTAYDTFGTQIVGLTAPNATALDAVLNTAVSFVGVSAQPGFNTLLAQAPYRFNGTTWDRNVKPNAVSRIPSSAADTNPTSAKASAGNLFQVNGYNLSATVTYLKFYRKATAPTVGTDTPFVTLALAPTSTFSFSFDSLYFSTGIAYGLTTDAADAGTTAVAAGAILGLNVVYS